MAESGAGRKRERGAAELCRAAGRGNGNGNDALKSRGYYVILEKISGSHEHLAIFISFLLGGEGGYGGLSYSAGKRPGSHGRFRGYV